MSSPSANWSKLTVVQLKEELTNRGLDTHGKKADLIEKLVQSESQTTELAGMFSFHLHIFIRHVHDDIMGICFHLDPKIESDVNGSEENMDEAVEPQESGIPAEEEQEVAVKAEPASEQAEVDDAAEPEAAEEPMDASDDVKQEDDIDDDGKEEEGDGTEVAEEASASAGNDAVTGDDEEKTEQEEEIISEELRGL